MSQDNIKGISRPIVSVGGKKDPSELLEGTELDLSGFVPSSEELDLSDLVPIDVDEADKSDLIPIETGTGKLHYKPPTKKVIPSIFEELGPVAVDATRLVGLAIDALDGVDGSGWSRPPLTEQMLRGVIGRHLRRESEIVDSNYVERLLTKAQELWKSNNPDDWATAKALRIKALAAPYEAARITDEALRLDAAMRESHLLPGGLLDIQLGGRTLWGIPDVHGNEWGWWMLWNTPLDDGMTLKEKLRDGDFVICLGDAFHPDFEPLDHWVPSANILLDIFRLNKDYPDRFWYTPGNHDVFYGGGEDVPNKGDTLQGLLFRDYLQKKYGLAFVRSAQAFIDRSPFFVRAMEGGETIAGLAHSPVVHGGMDIDGAILSPYDPILRYELTWNRPFDYEGNQPTTEQDLKDTVRKLASPHTILCGGHSWKSGNPAFSRPNGMLNFIIGLATHHFNDELGMFKIESDFVGIVNVVGEGELEGRNLRQEYIDSLKRKKGILRLLDFKETEKRPLRAVDADPLKKPRGGSCAYKQDPVDVSRAMSERKTDTGDGDERNTKMVSKGFWFGSISDVPLIVNADGVRFQIVGMFGSSVDGDAGEIMGATDELIIERREPNSEKPLRAFLRDGPTYIGSLTIFKNGKHLSIDIGAVREASIAQTSAIYLKRMEDGQARLTIHDPSSFAMRPTEIPEPTRVSTSTATPPPPPNGKTGFAGIVRSTAAAEPVDTFSEPAYPLEISALASAGMLESSMPGIDAITVSAMLAVPHLRV